MELYKIIERINTVFISKESTITQLKHEEDDEPYQVWKIESNNSIYILKEAKGMEVEIYQSILSVLQENVPTLYQVITTNDKTYLLMEYVEGKNLCECNRIKLTHALNALISLQKKTWNNSSFMLYGDSFENKLLHRQNRGKYLNDLLLEEAYEKFLKVYQSVPKTLCHDDLLPFNIIVNEEKAFLIDWETGGILPYPTSFVRLIAHVEENTTALFFMTEEDKSFAVDYYYENLLKEKGISYTEWRNTLEYFLFYEYCEWVFVGNKYNATDEEYYKKYLPIAKRQAAKILKLKNE